MATHHGGKVGAAAKTLASSSTSKPRNQRLRRLWSSTRLLSIASLRAKRDVAVGR